MGKSIYCRDQDLLIHDPSPDKFRGRGGPNRFVFWGARKSLLHELEVPRSFHGLAIFGCRELFGLFSWSVWVFFCGVVSPGAGLRWAWVDVHDLKVRTFVTWRGLQKTFGQRQVGLIVGSSCLGPSKGGSCDLWLLSSKLENIGRGERTHLHTFVLCKKVSRFTKDRFRLYEGPKMVVWRASLWQNRQGHREGLIVKRPGVPSKDKIGP